MGAIVRDDATSALSPELRFLIECCRVAISDASSKGRSIEPPSSELDWKNLVEEALWHGMLPLFNVGVRRAGTACAPSEIESALDIYVQRHADRAGQRVSELLEIIAALQNERISAIPFKGPLLAQLLYSDARSREFRDLDFLIRAQDTPATLRVLNKLGYVASLEERQLSPRAKAALHRYDGQAILWHYKTKLPVEPHWAIAPWVMAVDMDYAAIWRRAGEADLARATVPSMAPEDLFIVLCVHGSKEQWSRLKLVADIARLLVVHGSIDWSAVLKRARDQGCLRMVLLGISLAHRLFDVAAPKELFDILSEDRVVESLVRRVYQASLQRHFDSQHLNHYQLSTFRFRMRERVQDQFQYILRTVFTPRMAHFRMLPLPDPLFPLYYPLKLVHDYLVLPMWTVLKRVGLAPTSERTPQ